LSLELYNFELIINLKVQTSEMAYNPVVRGAGLSGPAGTNNPNTGGSIG